MLLVGRVPRQQLTATSKPLWLGLTRGQRALDASTLLTVGRIDGMGISRRLRDVTCQSLLTALLRGVGSRRRGLTLLGSLDPVYGPSEPRGKTTPPRPGGAWHIHSTNTYRCGWVGEKSYCVIGSGMAETWLPPLLPGSQGDHFGPSDHLQGTGSYTIALCKSKARTGRERRLQHRAARRGPHTREE